MLSKDILNGNLPRHNHDGLNSEKVKGRDLGGFEVRTVAPTEPAEEGKVVLSNVAGTYKIHAYINGGWRSTTLT